MPSSRARTLKSALFALAVAAAPRPAQAQSFEQFSAHSNPRPVADSASAAPRAADDALYRALGGDAGLHGLIDDYVAKMIADERLRPFFAKTNLDDLRKHLFEQFCVIAGGPCDYTGARMKSVHADFAIHMSDFNALVAALQDTMDAREIPFAAQKALLARLAPMHRDIVNTP